MGSIVLDLQQEVLKPDCDIVNALRKAHLIAYKLKLSEFDSWIQSELNGYTNQRSNDIPPYRSIRGTLKAWNQYKGWETVMFQSTETEKAVCETFLSNSIVEAIDLYNSAESCFYIGLTSDMERDLDKASHSMLPTNYRLECGKHYLKAIIEGVKNNLLEWTLQLESQGIVGENLQFSQQEKTIAHGIPQQINYYGPVINGPVQESQVFSGDHNTVSFSYEQANDLLSEVKEAVAKEALSEEARETASELLSEAEEKIAAKKKPGIIKASLTGLKDFLISVGSSVAAGLIMEFLQQGGF